ncbi:MAG: SH3 domain-containing protein [Chloroflexota bacterium]
MSLNYFGDFRNFQRPPETTGAAAAFLIVLFVIGLAAAMFALGFGWISIDLISQEAALKNAGRTTPSPSQNLTVLDWDIPDGHFYTQTNGEIPGTSAMGFSVTNRDGIPFWDEFQRLGGFSAVGYPISARFQWKGLTTQAFQKAVMQWNPETGQVDLVNTMDELHFAGKDEWLLKEYSVPKPVPDDFDVGRTWEQARDNRMLFIGKSQAMVDKYKSVPDPLKLYGLPCSAIEEMEDHKVIRLQRGVLRQWTEDKPGAKVGEVTVANAGEILLNSGLVASAKTKLEQGQPPAPTPAPTGAPQPTPTAAFKPLSGSIIIVAPTPGPNQTPAPGATPTVAPTKLVRIGNTGGVGAYIRKSPHLDDKLIAWHDNTQLKVIGEPVQSDGLQWYNVEDPRGNKGWIPVQWVIQ